MGTPSEEAVTFDVVKRCIGYREDGSLVWLAKPGSSSPIVVGSPTGTTLRGGEKRYRAAHIKGKKLLTHRIVWALHNGGWPNGKIDHIDGDEANNRIENLREASSSQNSMNRKNRSDNKSGLKGARLRKNRDGTPVWVSAIWIDGKAKYLGRFKSPEEAHAAYMAAANDHFGDFARAS